MAETDLAVFKTPHTAPSLICKASTTAWAASRFGSFPDLALAARASSPFDWMRYEGEAVALASEGWAGPRHVLQKELTRRLTRLNGCD